MERTGKKRVGFLIASGLVFLMMLAVLELNRNTVWGFVLTLLLSAGFWAAQRTGFLRKRRLCRALAWVLWLGLFFAVLRLTWPPVRPVPAVEQDDPRRTEIVTVAQGQLRGVLTEDGAVEVYTGVPYARPPVGDLRWAEPQAPEPWEGVLEADHYAPMSMQPVNLPIYDSLAQIIGYHDYHLSLDDSWIPPVSEDSLYLNIWKPAGDASGLPVMVYVHGGSLQTGQPWYEDYSGEGLAREGVIVVNMGYRLGVFGFFAGEELAAGSEHGTTGSYGLLDQIAALEWVRDNIAAFGGDPENVTLAGESAGALCVSALCASPPAKGLFRRVILESSTAVSTEPAHSYRPLEEALQSGRELMERHGCSSVEELRALPAEKLVREADSQHHITLDGYVLPELPCEVYRRGENNEEAVLHGYNAEESGPFLLFEITTAGNYEDKVRQSFEEYADEVLALYPGETNREAAESWGILWGAALFDYPHYCLNRLAAENGLPVYEYRFSRDNGRLGCWHSGEEVYCFGNIPEGSKLYDDRDRALGAEMTAYWANFIKTGDPNGGTLPVWEQNRTSEDLMGFGDETAMVKEGEHALFDILDRRDGWGEPAA